MHHPRWRQQPVLLLFLLIPFVSLSQTHVVKGTVKEADGQPIYGASVTVKGTAKGTQTASDGSFTLNAGSSNATIEISFVGYATQSIALKGRTSIDVKLIPMGSDDGPVIVVGYGSQRKRDVTGAISSIRNKEFKDQPVSNVAASIQGKVSGVLVTSPSGTPGAGLLVSVRGAHNPLYVVDGVPMISESNSALSTSYDTNGDEQGSGQNLSSISDINPDDIESIEILKDASSASIYGARAANGVVLITTKRGRAGKTEFSFNSYTGVQQVSRKIPFLDSKGFTALVEDARKQDLIAYQQDPTPFIDAYPGFDPAVLTNPLPSTWNSNVNTNWLNEIFRTAPISNIQLSARGGNEKTRFFLGGSYFDQQGIVIDNYYKRASFRMNIDNKVNDHISIGANTSFTYGKNKRSFNDDTYTGVVTNAIGASPLMPVYNSDGSYSDYTQYQATWLSDNPVKSAKEVKAFSTNYRFIGSVFADATILKGLRFKTSFSTDYSNLVDDQFFSPITSDGAPVGGKALAGNYRSLTWLNENILTYSLNSGKNTINALGGFTVQSSRYERTSMAGQGFPTGSGLQNISSASTITSAKAQQFGWGLVSFLARVNYSYDTRYLLSLSARYDGSSRFDPSARWGLFPAVSAGWILSKEKFMKKIDWIESLKLRASYGITGDQEIGDFQYLSYWTPSRYDGNAGLRPGSFGNPNLTWQRNKMFNIGVDFDLFRGRLGGSIEYFRGNRTKLLAQAVLPATSGFPSYTTNAGEIENKGVELSLTGIPVKNRQFTWTVNFNISFIKDRILSLYSDNEQLSAYKDLSPTHILKVGYAVGTFIGYQYLGVDQQTGMPSWGNDVVPLGKATPDFFGGLTNEFRYGNWDLSIVTQFSAGNKVMNLIRTTYQTLGNSPGGWDANNDLYQVFANNATIVNNRWMKPGDRTDIPRASLIFANYNQQSSQFLENASFFRIRTLNLGYTIRPKNPGKFNSLRLYGQVQNPWVFTKYYGFDPEVSSNGGSKPETAGVDYAAYPQARTFTFGVNFTF